MYLFCCCTGACSLVEEVMLQEAFDLPSTQILSLHALGTYLATRPQLTVSETTATWELLRQQTTTEYSCTQIHSTSTLN